jgi:hypothetical protein
LDFSYVYVLLYSYVTEQNVHLFGPQLPIEYQFNSTPLSKAKKGQGIR